MSSPARVAFRPQLIDGYETGALDISVKNRRVLSIPTQLGCRVGCIFCVSKHAPLVRNLSVPEMLAMVATCFKAEPPDGRPVELSFTGEGEALLNWKNTSRLVDLAVEAYPEIVAARYCFSGFGASKLLPRLPVAAVPVRLQFSLHAARQSIRDGLVPHSEPLDALAAVLQENAPRFSAVELNVALQDGVNDSEEDLRALASWGESTWPILLSPLLADGAEIIGTRTEHFAEALRASGRTVKVYSRVGSLISRQRLYPSMSARPVLWARAAGDAPA